MNEQLQTILLNLVQRSITALDSGAEFLASEIPEVIQQLLVWKAIESFIWFIFILFLSGMVIYYGGIKGFQLARFHQESSDGLSYGLWGVLFALAFAATIPSLFYQMDWLQILVAPKLYLLEYAAELVKGK